MAVSVNLQNDRVYGKGKNSDIRDENLFSLTNKMSKKVMLTAAISWYGVIKPFLVNNNGIKVNKESYCPHLRKECFLLWEKLLNVMIEYFVKMERHLIDPIWNKIFLKQN